MKYLSPLILALLVSSLEAGSLDLMELNTVQYNVEILDTPVTDTQTQDMSEGAATPAVTMVNKSGQKYRCSLPEVPERDSGDAKEEEEAAPDVSSLLAPLEDGPCMFKTKDWWTYEVCHRRSVRQYHVENDKPVGHIMVLGLHEAAKDNFEPSNATYLAQWYTNGSKCDLTGQPRQTELRFVCNEAAVQDFIGDIFEPQSCEYTIVVHTSRLCTVPWLRPPQEPTPLPIVCQPLLTTEQMEKYNRYIERKQIADQLAAKKKKAEQKELMAKKLGGSHLGDGSGELSLDGLLSGMGDSVAENLVTEIGQLLDNAMKGNTQGGVKVIDLRNKGEKKEEEESVEEASEEKTKPAPVEAKASEGWDLVHQKHTPPSDPELRQLISERNKLWRQIHEAKKSVKKYSSQLHDTTTFLENEKKDVFQNSKVTEKLEMQKKTIERALARSRDIVALFEDESKNVAHQIVAAQSRLRNSNAQMEEKVWLKRLEQIEGMASFDEDVFALLLDMATDYRKLTNEWLANIEEYFRVASKVVGDKVSKEKMKDLERFMKTFEHFLPSKEEVLIHLADTAELPDGNPELVKDDLRNAAKFRDVVKDEIRENFQDILKEVSEELDIPEGDVDKDEAMAAMSKTLDQLMNKLSGAGEKLEHVQKTVDNLKKLSDNKEATDELVSLKRDNKHSVKKDLSRMKEPAEDDEEEDDLEDFADEVIEQTVNVLGQAEEEVAQLEKEVKEMAVSRDDMVRVSVTNMSPGVEPDEDTEKVVRKLEDTIKDKLSKLGLDTGGRPIEVKLITTQIPEGLAEEGEGAPNDAQAQGMFFNMMTGNIQGYEDINSQRKFENSYKFNWNEDVIEDVEQKILEFSEIETSATENDVITEVFEEGEKSVDNLDDFYHGGDSRERPSSLNSKTESEHSASDNQGSEGRDEL